ncbi:MAG: glutamate synthase [Phycisphaerales bacterium]|nr:glutamate synthase [Phycisphaerales bacterium]
MVIHDRRRSMSDSRPGVYECDVCGFVYDEGKEGVPFKNLPDDWECPVCGATKDQFQPVAAEPAKPAEKQAHKPDGGGDYLKEWARSSDDLETHMADIHQMAATGQSILEPMRTRRPVISWDDLLFKGGQLARLPIDHHEPVNTKTIIGPKAAQPLEIDTPIYVTHMSFGALSEEVKIALARGSAAVRTAMCSGEGGILPESLASAYRYIFEYVPNRYSVTDENLRQVSAVEIKIGQSAKPGMGGHLPGAKVTSRIAEIRGFPAGRDIISPAGFDDIRDREELKAKVRWLREKTGGKPVGIKLAAGHIEADLEIALYAEPDFITIDGRPGATGAASKFVKAATSIPTIFALVRARAFLDKAKADGVSLVITGGLRVSSDFAKALALGADAVAIGTGALMACGCQQYRQCHTGRCPVGVATQDSNLRGRLDSDNSAKRLANYLRVCTEELCDFARLTGNRDVHDLAVTDLCTTNSEISEYTAISHV